MSIITVCFERESRLAVRAGRRLDEKKIKVRNANAQENELTFAYDALSGPTEHLKFVGDKSICGGCYLPLLPSPLG